MAYPSTREGTHAMMGAMMGGATCHQWCPGRAHCESSGPHGGFTLSECHRWCPGRADREGSGPTCGPILSSANR